MLKELVKENKIYGVGLGVGDPELVTVKALRVIREADCVVLPTGNKDTCHAYKIAKSIYPEIEARETLCFDFPMTRDAQILEARRDRIYAGVKERYLAGRMIAFLVIGDPNLYATYSYIELRAMRDGISCESIPGINSFSAAAAVLNLPLVLDDEELHIIPGSAGLEEAIRLPGTKVFMKLGKKIREFNELAKPLVQAGKAELYAVEKCGMEGQRVFREVAGLPEDLGYLATVILKEKRPYTSHVLT